MPAPRLRKRHLATTLAVALVVALGVHVLFLGSVPGPVPALPTTPAEGTRTHLVALEGGRREVWSSRVLAAPLPALWAVITDYAAFARVFPGLEELHAAPVHGGVYRLTGRARILGMDIPVESEVTHAPGDRRAQVFWDTPSEALPVNRGSWDLEAVPGGTRVTYRLEIEMARIPRALCHAYLVDNLALLLEALAQEVRRRGGESP